ncbi:glycerophosphodiester phosphodiesterase [Bordetella genomosp. 7]|uniref:glycerophosphodiester phosphodiesterase n=1 Tax=Bordetella genomosp. 7 TaxID=1416805 RepID=UPI000B9EABC1|nr:glycerophosphodiester phosphodiesterase [Bordetella genomosp. 7]OZI27159.1 glycerophosphodiester phosphodiesterase [Bordetella genomosp. 7]
MPAPWPYPSHIAHRGGGLLAPENTLAAMRAGARHGFRMVEFDVKLSRDGVPFLLHDDTLDRTTDAQGPAAGLAYADLARLDAGGWHSPAYTGEPVPTFRAVARYAIANGIACNVEIKPNPGQDTQTGTAVAMAARQLWQDVGPAPLLSSFSEAALEAARVAAPELPRALLVEEVPQDWLQRLRRYECVALNINHRDATPALIDAVHEAGFRIAAWTINDPARARLLLSWGLDGIFTDALADIAPPK